VPADGAVAEALRAEDRVALVYARPDGERAGGDGAFNPNGSVDDVAGICDSSGLVLGLMPHPERHVTGVQHPSWTRTSGDREIGAGRLFFDNATAYCLESLGAGV
jgi:phosphoribosylformylglycinamidine synthase